MSIPIARLATIALLLLSLACCGLSAVVAISPFFVELEMIDGTVASPGMGVLTGIVVAIPALLMLVTSGLIWFVVRPEQYASKAQAAQIERLGDLTLQLYAQWLMPMSATLRAPTNSDDHRWRQEAGLQARQLFAELDSRRRRQLLQLLYDLELLRGEWALDLHGSDLGETDLSDIDLREAVLMGVNLRKTTLRGARLDAADLRETQVTAEQLAAVASATGVRLARTDEAAVTLHPPLTKNGTQ